MITGNQFSTPPVVKNLLIINALFFMATSFLPQDTAVTIIEKLGLFYVESPYFMPHQIITYMFLHANFGHLFFNMFALWMFGRVLEHNLGSKRFLTYYMVCGMGAALLQMGVNAIEIANFKSGLDLATPYGQMALAYRVNIPTIGASGSVFGLLLGFGMFHPNSIIMLIFPPIRMKAKYFVIIYGVLELLFGLSGKADGVAHFAHIGGMLWGFILLWWWKKKGKVYY